MEILLICIPGGVPFGIAAWVTVEVVEDKRERRRATSASPENCGESRNVYIALYIWSRGADLCVTRGETWSILNPIYRENGTVKIAGRTASRIEEESKAGYGAVEAWYYWANTRRALLSRSRIG